MKEKDFQSEFNKYAKYIHKQTGAYELKLAKGSSLPFDAVKDHQVQALLNAKHSHIVYKITDTGFAQKPFDCFSLVGVPAYVVIMFYERGQKEFFMIDVDTWVEEKTNSVRRSLTSDRAREIGSVCYLK